MSLRPFVPFFQRTIIRAVIHIHRQHRHAVPLGIADELGGGVEAHRLRVEHRADECRRVVAFQPGRHVDQQRERRRVTLGKAVFAEAADLLENLLGERRRVAVGEHAAHEPHLELLDLSAAPPGRHRAAQLVRLAGREPGRDDRQPHDLLLKQRHAQGFLEYAADGFAGIGHRLDAVAPAQIWVYHAPLDWSRPHNSHFNDQIVEAARLQPGQHGHLRAALDLEHSHRVGGADEVVDGGVFRGDVVQGRRD